jgi:SRSO17 transposase
MTYARPAAPTVTFVDEYCQLYQDLFPDVRSFEHFKQLHIGMLSEIKRKTLPAIAKATGESDPQALHHFVAYARLSCRKAAGKATEQAKAGTGGKSVDAVHR